MSDNQVIEAVRARYEREPRLDHPGELAISERAGTVTLRGTVRSLHQRRVAIDLAKSARGVRAVEDELVVDPRDHSDDTQIRGAALNTLLADPHVPETVDVTVANGWLTLSGRVKHQYESNAAFEAVARLPHVGGITNKIQVVTAGGY
jgi:osmotically-inducible protein OsmY